MLNAIKIHTLLLSGTLLLNATFSAIAYAADNEVNLYSARKEKLIKPLLDKFTEQTDIKVNLVTGKADALLKRLQSEGNNSPADLLITTDAGRLARAVEADVIQPVTSEVLNQRIPESLRDTSNYWYGLSVRARPIFYVKGKVKADELSTYEALANEKWNGRICIRSSGNIYNQSLLASMISHSGKATTQDWANAFTKNLARKPKGGDRDQIKAAAAGQCDIAIANTYYYGRMLKGKDEAQKTAAEKMELFWPNQADRGTHVNVSGIALTRSSKNRDNAVKLMEFLVNDESQKWYAEVNNEYPVVKGIEASDILKSWGEFKADTLNLSELGKHNTEAVKIMDRAGWK